MSSAQTAMFNLLRQGFQQLYDTELEALCIAIGAADDSITEGEGDEHRDEVIGLIFDRLEAVAMPKANKTKAKAKSEEDDEAEAKKEKAKQAAAAKVAVCECHGLPKNACPDEKPSNVAYTREHYSKMSVADLRTFCKEVGAKCTGAKAKLIDNLYEKEYIQYREEKMQEYLDDNEDMSPEEALEQVNSDWEQCQE